MLSRYRARAAAVAAGLALLLSGCSTSFAFGLGDPGGRIFAVGAESEYANVIQQVGGKYVQVSAILSNPNTDPHTFEASAAVGRLLNEAQLVVQNGAGYDTFMNTIEGAVPSSSRKLIVVQDRLGLPESTPNPHLWYRPGTMSAVADAIATDLTAIQPAHAAYFKARAAAFARSLNAWTSAIAAFKSTYPGTPVATTEPVADYMLQAMGTDNLTPYRFQADIMNGVDPAPQDVSLVTGFFTHHRAKVFVYNQQVTDALSTSIRMTALHAGVPVVGVYETMPAGYRYQSWMLAEVRAIQRAVASKTSTEKL